MLPPETVSSASATAGDPSCRNWFQTPVTVTASATAPGSKPQARNIPYARAIPTAGPPAGATYVDAVEAWVTVSAGTNLSPGSAAMNGGA